MFANKLSYCVEMNRKQMLPAMVKKSQQKCYFIHNLLLRVKTCKNRDTIL